MEQLNQDSLATLLLCSDLGLDSEMKKKYKPYTVVQWNKLVDRIINSNIKKPSNLLGTDIKLLKSELLLKDDEANRIEFLLTRGGNIAIEIENLEGSGIYITTRAESNYPYRLKKVLKNYSPPIIYYSGDINLTKKRSVAVVGSRDVDDNGILFTKELAIKCAKEGYVIVSGGAKGVDSVAENTIIKNNGYAISIVSDNLAKKIKEKHIRDSIIKGQFLIMSTVNPKANFTVYGAMDRNKYVYGLADYAVVVSSSYNKGGTWTGAIENIKKKWSSLFVRNDESVPVGNNKILELGGRPVYFKDVTDDGIFIEELFKMEKEQKLNQDKIEQISIYNLSKNAKVENRMSVMEGELEESLDVYNIILPYIKRAIKEPKNQKEISEALNVNNTQISKWLARAIEDNEIKKLKTPIRYALKDY